MSDELNTPPEADQTSVAESAELSNEQVQPEIDELSAARERLARIAAELDNYRKRSQREMENQRRYAALPLLKDLVPVVDNLQHALNAAESASDATEMRRGVQMIYDQLYEVMQRHGCEKFGAVGDPFDPEFHEAVRQVPGEPGGVVVEVLQPGYRLHDRIVRPARVAVSSGQT